jgi:hypothetical protein
MNSPVPVSQDCTPAICRVECALQVIDSLLRAAGNVRGEEVDELLDLRCLIRRRQDAEAALTLFCQLRRTMEEGHYLAFYRLRRWFENQVLAGVRLRPGVPERRIPLKLDRYCMEAVRSHCLLSVLQPREPLLASRVEFLYRDLENRPEARPRNCCSLLEPVQLANDR